MLTKQVQNAVEKYLPKDVSTIVLVVYLIHKVKDCELTEEMKGLLGFQYSNFDRYDYVLPIVGSFFIETDKLFPLFVIYYTQIDYPKDPRRIAILENKNDKWCINEDVESGSELFFRLYGKYFYNF